MRPCDPLVCTSTFPTKNVPPRTRPHSSRYGGHVCLSSFPPQGAWDVAGLGSKKSVFPLSCPQLRKQIIYIIVLHHVCIRIPFSPTSLVISAAPSMEWGFEELVPEPRQVGSSELSSWRPFSFMYRSCSNPQDEQNLQRSKPQTKEVKFSWKRGFMSSAFHLVLPLWIWYKWINRSCPPLIAGMHSTCITQQHQSSAPHLMQISSPLGAQHHKTTTHKHWSQTAGSVVPVMLVMVADLAWQLAWRDFPKEQMSKWRGLSFYLCEFLKFLTMCNI